MWFVTTMHKIPKFYSLDNAVIEVSAIEWVDNDEVNSSLLVKDSMQAITVLFQAGIKGFPTKQEAREFGKALGIPNWKYLKIT